ncbi:hypothetical protein WN943_026470 [Citrus x changshan-huyou]
MPGFFLWRFPFPFPLTSCCSEPILISTGSAVQQQLAHQHRQPKGFIFQQRMPHSCIPDILKYKLLLLVLHSLIKDDHHSSYFLPSP